MTLLGIHPIGDTVFKLQIPIYQIKSSLKKKLKESNDTSLWKTMPYSSDSKAQLTASSAEQVSFYVTIIPRESHSNYISYLLEEYKDACTYELCCLRPYSMLRMNL